MNLHVALPATTDQPQRWLFVRKGEPQWLTEEEALANPKDLNLASVPEATVQGWGDKYGKLETYPATEEEPQEEPVMSEKETKKPAMFKIRRRGNARAHESNGLFTKPWQKSIAPYINVLYVLLILGVFFVCLWNIFPYELAVRFVASRFLDSGILGFVLALPVIGWILGFIGNAIYWIVGAIVWGVIQLIELLPLVMTSNPGYVRSVLREQEAHERIRPREDDPGPVRYLKKFYNHLPMRFLSTARRLRGWVYVLDMLIVMMVYPPVREGGVGRFFFLLSTGQWSQFDWANIVLMFVTLLAVEAIVKVLMIVNHFRNYIKASKAQTVAA